MTGLPFPSSHWPPAWCNDIGTPRAARSHSPGSSSDRSQSLVRGLICLPQHHKGTLDGPDVRLAPIYLMPSLLLLFVDFSKVPQHVILVYILRWQSQLGTNFVDEEVVSSMASLVLRLNDSMFLDHIMNIGATLWLTLGGVWHRMVGCRVRLRQHFSSPVPALVLLFCDVFLLPFSNLDRAIFGICQCDGLTQA